MEKCRRKFVGRRRVGVEDWCMVHGKARLLRGVLGVLYSVAYCGVRISLAVL